MTLPHNCLLTAVNHLFVAFVKILIWEKYFALYNITNVGRTAIYEALEKVSFNIDDVGNTMIVITTRWKRNFSKTYLYYKHYNSQSAELHLDGRKGRKPANFKLELLHMRKFHLLSYIQCTFVHTHAFLKSNFFYCVEVLDTVCTRL